MAYTNKINTPHAQFFKETFTRKENAVSFFREYLPENVASGADWRTLRITKDTFISLRLRERMSDSLYTVRMKGLLVFLYLLFGHQPTVDALMPLRFHYPPVSGHGRCASVDKGLHAQV